MTPSERIIGAFGGVCEMARKLTEAGGKPVPVTTVSSWKTAGYIPSKRQQAVLDCAHRHGIAITPADFFEAERAA